MKPLPCTLLSILLLPSLSLAFAQPPGSKPVLSATPPPPAAAPLAPAAAAAGPAMPVAVDPNYVIGAEDSLQVTVWQEPNFSGGLPVRPDGMITLPLVGDLMAAGRTPMQLSGDITEKLKKFITDPTVNVSVLAVNSKHIYLVGEVGRVGPLAMTPGMTILQAIVSAGGVTPFANKKKIYILRGEAGSQQKIPFDYTKAVKKGDMQGIVLVPGDTIVVP
jgi:polysaccharide export outer membrane protein